MAQDVIMTFAYYIRVEGKSHYQERWSNGRLGPLEVLRHQPSIKGPFRTLSEAKSVVQRCCRQFERNGCWVSRMQIRRHSITEDNLRKCEASRLPFRTTTK